MMTTSDITRIKYSWKKLRLLNPCTLGDLFYSRLFTQQPRIRNLFPADMKDQYIKWVEGVGFIVARLEDQEDMESVLRELGIRHVRYGVTTAHYRMVQEALLWTLQQALEADWNIEMELAWTTCCQMIIGCMLPQPDLI